MPNWLRSSMLGLLSACVCMGKKIQLVHVATRWRSYLYSPLWLHLYSSDTENSRRLSNYGGPSLIQIALIWIRSPTPIAFTNPRISLIWIPPSPKLFGLARVHCIMHYIGPKVCKSTLLKQSYV
jgi:hypothetical protein